MSRRLFLCLLFLLAGGVIDVAAQQRPGPRRPRRPAEVLNAGMAAPDFELHRLAVVERDGESVGVVSDETARLSSFKGQKPVVLVFSSYT